MVNTLHGRFLVYLSRELQLFSGASAADQGGKKLASERRPKRADGKIGIFFLTK
jgi:hypothetical protein